MQALKVLMMRQPAAVKFTLLPLARQHIKSLEQAFYPIVKFLTNAASQCINQLPSKARGNTLIYVLID